MIEGDGGFAALWEVLTPGLLAEKAWPTVAFSVWVGLGANVATILPSEVMVIFPLVLLVKARDVVVGGGLRRCGRKQRSLTLALRAIQR